MNGRKQRLELTWIGKDDRPNVEPRILLEDPDLSYGSKKYGHGTFENRLIFGDNLLALKALQADFFGKVDCIYIDPPYNTGSAFEHYDDGLTHSTWLSMMRDRLEILWSLLKPTGFFCCHIDDSEGHYLKVLLDDVFGRSNYLSTMYVQVRYPEKTLKQDMDFHKEVEQVHIYRRDFGARPVLNAKDSSFEKYTYYVSERYSGRETEIGGKRVVVFSPSEYEIIASEPGPDGRKEIWATGTILDGNSSGRFFRDFLQGRVEVDGLGALYKVYGIGDDKFDHRYFSGPKRIGATKGKYYQGVPISQLSSPNEAIFSPIENFYDLAGSFGNCRHEGGVEFRSGKKPERLLQLILKHFSRPGDLVLDSFAGSGTTGAVAHKMGRRWIMIELGEHCHTHIIPRLRKVVDGDDGGGISEAAGWEGGGGFRYFRLAPSLLEKDRWGNWIIARSYNAAMLAEAMCKHMGFNYAPSQDPAEYWRHGYSSERDFIFVTTANVTHDQLRAISEDVGPERTLLVCCKAFNARADAFENLTVKKIPQAVLSRCEWGRDDYSLRIAEAPPASKDTPPPATSEAVPPKRGRRAAAASTEPSLFSAMDAKGAGK